MTDVLAQAVLAEHVAYSALLACEQWRNVGAGSGCFRRMDPGHGGRRGTADSCGGCGMPLGLWWEGQICSSWRAVSAACWPLFPSSSAQNATYRYVGDALGLATLPACSPSLQRLCGCCTTRCRRSSESACLLWGWAKHPCRATISGCTLSSIRANCRLLAFSGTACAVRFSGALTLPRMPPRSLPAG